MELDGSEIMTLKPGWRFALLALPLPLPSPVLVPVFLEGNPVWLMADTVCGVVIGPCCSARHYASLV